MKPATIEAFDENQPLTESEFQRLEHNALAMVAREYFSECPQCMLEAPLVVRALVELRELRGQVADLIHAVNS